MRRILHTALSELKIYHLSFLIMHMLRSILLEFLSTRSSYNKQVNLDLTYSPENSGCSKKYKLLRCCSSLLESVPIAPFTTRVMLTIIIIIIIIINTTHFLSFEWSHFWISSTHLKVII